MAPPASGARNFRQAMELSRANAGWIHHFRWNPSPPRRSQGFGAVQKALGSRRVDQNSRRSNTSYPWAGWIRPQAFHLNRLTPCWVAGSRSRAKACRYPVPQIPGPQCTAGLNRPSLSKFQDVPRGGVQPTSSGSVGYQIHKCMPMARPHLAGPSGPYHSAVCPGCQAPFLIKL